MPLSILLIKFQPLFFWLLIQTSILFFLFFLLDHMQTMVYHELSTCWPQVNVTKKYLSAYSFHLCLYTYFIECFHQLYILIKLFFSFYFSRNSLTRLLNWLIHITWVFLVHIYRHRQFTWSWTQQKVHFLQKDFWINWLRLWFIMKRKLLENHILKNSKLNILFIILFVNFSSYIIFSFSVALFVCFFLPLFLKMSVLKFWQIIFIWKIIF